jgi:hypothetical protein
MTVLSPTVEQILDKLVQVAGGDPALVEEALAKASGNRAQVPTLEQVVDYIVERRRPSAQQVPA